MMDWEGPILCVSRDPLSLINGVIEAGNLSKNNDSPIFIVSISKSKEDKYLVDLITFDTVKNMTLKRNSPQKNFKISQEKRKNNKKDFEDKDFRQWLIDENLNQNPCFFDFYRLEKI